MVKNVCLVDEGTLDTVFLVNGKRIAFDCNYAIQWRDKDGDFTDEGYKQAINEAIDVYYEMYGIY